MNKDGFLLIELLIALSLFVVGVFVITKFQSIALDNYTFAIRKLKALNLALENEKEKGRMQNSKIYKIDVKKINYGLQINNMFLQLKKMLDKNLMFNPKEFNVREVIVSFNSTKGKKSELKIKKSY